MDKEETVVAVESAGKETDQFNFIQMFGKRFPCAVRFGKKALILGGKFGDRVKILHFGDEPVIRFDDIFAGTEFLDRFLRLVLVIPEIGARHDTFQIRHFLLVFFDLQELVKMRESRVRFLCMRSDFFNNHNFFLYQAVVLVQNCFHVLY